LAKSLRNWWAVQKARANYGEFAGAVVRVGLTLILLGYYGWMDWSKQAWVLYVYWSFVAYAFITFCWVYRASKSSNAFRILTLVTDIGAATFLLGLTGERSAIVLFLYTWAPVAHGFRFGLRYLHVAWIIGLVAFLLVYALSAAVNGFWYQHPLVWLGAFIWIAAPTFYVAQLLKQKLVAVQAAEDARIQMERAHAEAERERVERARAEAERARSEAEAANEAKSEFLATMSHEMRTPLNGVVGAAEMLAAKDLPSRERQLVDWLLASSRQLRSLIDNLLDLRKIEAGKMNIEHTPFDLHVLMNRLAALFEPEAKRTHLRLTKSVSLVAPYLLLGDDARIQQVLINLTGNALKFTREGFVRVSVAAKEQTDHDVTLRFEVRDTGIGISPENAKNIFDRFTQADPSIHRQYGGSGLGTTICKHLVELMGGAIGFDSQQGEGTTFWFTVPLSRQPLEAYENEVEPPIDAVRLFLVSDRPGADGWLAKIAQEKHLQYASFPSIQEALTAARRDGNREFCVMIVDGEDSRVPWRGVPAMVKRTDTQMPCILIHSDTDETSAFDAGYACLLSSRKWPLVSRAIRSVVAGDSSQQPLEGSSGQAVLGRTGLHILVAEDNQISQQIIAMMLQAGGHHVTLVSDGESVLENYGSASFDVIILDMHMPGRTGLEAAKAIRLLEATGPMPRVPIIMLTAGASTDLRDHSQSAGIDLFLSKPVDPRALLREVNQVFSTDRLESSISTLPKGGKEYIDRVLLQDMAILAGDSRFMRVLAINFSRDAGQLIDKMEAAMFQKDHRQLRELTHTLKGTAMMAGAIRLSDSAARIESIADSDFAGVSVKLIEELRGMLEATNHELSQLVA
jgi:two-component system, sensor histidine kinase RpfC